MEQRQGRYSIIVLLLLVSLVVGFSTYTVYKRAGGSLNSNSFLKPNNFPGVLGEQTSLNESTPNQTPLIPSAYDISEEQIEPKSIETRDEESDSGVSDFSQETLGKIEQKANLISSQVEKGNIKPEELFSPVLVDFYGADDLQKVFGGVKSISFSNFQLNTQTEATADCVLTEDTLSAEHICYFNLFENTWYLYKTTLR